MATAAEELSGASNEIGSQVEKTTITTRVAVEQATRAQGYAIVNEELEFGLRSIAAPLVQKSGKVSIALNISAQAGRVPAAEMEERFLPALRAASEALRYTF